MTLSSILSKCASAEGASLFSIEALACCAQTFHGDDFHDLIPYTKSTAKYEKMLDEKVENAKKSEQLMVCLRYSSTNVIGIIAITVQSVSIPSSESHLIQDMC